MKTKYDFRMLVILTIFVLAFAYTPQVQAGLTWSDTNQYDDKVIPGFNDELFIRNGNCLDWPQLLSLNPNLPQTGFSIAYMNNDSLSREFGALFHVEGSGEPQKFHVWVLSHDGSTSGSPPPGGSLMVQMRRVTNPNLNEGFDPDVEIPFIDYSQAAVSWAGGTEPCWRHARIDKLKKPVPEGDYWFTFFWSPDMRNTFSFVVDTDALNDGLVIIPKPPQWTRGFINDPMIVISQDSVTPFVCEPPTARIVATDAGDTNVPITVDGSTSGLGSGDSLTYTWSFVSKPEGSESSFDDATATKATFTPDKGDADGEKYVVQLEVCNFCDCDTTQHTITVQTARPTVKAPKISPEVVHAGDKSTVIHLSVEVSDPNPNVNLEYNWVVRRRDTGKTKEFSEAESPNYRLLATGLGDRGPFEDTFYDIWVEVRNTFTDLTPTKSPESTLQISRWPELSFIVGETSWGEDMTFDLPITVTLQTYDLRVFSGSTTKLRLIDPDDGSILDEESGDIIGVFAHDTQQFFLTLHDRLVWDPFFCITHVPTGPTSITENMTVEFREIFDENYFDFNVVVPSQQFTTLIVSVPLAKIIEFGNANRAFTLGKSFSIRAIPYTVAAAFGCVPCAITAAILFAAEAYELFQYHHHCTEAHDDPPGIDPDYISVVTVNIPEIDTTSDIAPDEPSRLAMVAAEQGALIQAVRTAYNQTYNKVFGAYQAGNSDGALRQSTELIRLGAIFDKELATHAANLLAAQDAVGLPSIADVRSFQRQVATDGLPEREIDVLQQLGADQDEINEIEANFVATDPTVIAEGLPDSLDEKLRPFGDFYTNHSRGIVLGGYVIVAVTEPLYGQPVQGTVNIQARVVHKKETTSFCLCGPTLVTNVQVDGQPFNSVPYPQAPWCPTPPQPFQQAVPVQIDTTTLTDGAHTITVGARDACRPGPAPADPREHINSDTITFFVDNTPPTLIITSPDADPDVSGIQVPAGDNITYLAEDPVVNDYSSGVVDPFQGVLPTQFSGTYDVTVRVADRAGNTTMVTVNVVEDVDGNGIPDSIDNECPCEGQWRNHGDYVSCVAHAAGALKKAGRITGAQASASVRAAAKSRCGKK